MWEDGDKNKGARGSPLKLATVSMEMALAKCLLDQGNEVWALDSLHMYSFLSLFLESCDEGLLIIYIRGHGNIWGDGLHVHCSDHAPFRGILPLQHSH